MKASPLTLGRTLTRHQDEETWIRWRLYYTNYKSFGISFKQIGRSNLEIKVSPLTQTTMREFRNGMPLSVANAFLL